MGGFRHLDEHEVHRGHVWRVVVADFESPDGERFRRDVVRSPGAVAVVALSFDPEGLPVTVLVRQYRPTIDDVVVEIPAGMRDVADEPPEVTAERELVEEAGLRPGHLSHLVDVLPSPGMTDAVTKVYLATDCVEVPRDTHGPEEAHMTVEHVGLADALAMVDRGEILDSKTVAGLLMADRRLRAGDAGPGATGAS